jgi:hypothetical protein
MYRNAYRGLVTKHEGKRPLGSPTRKWKKHNNMQFLKIGSGGTDWTDLAQNRDQWWALVNTVMNHRIPKYVGKFLRS